MLLWHWRKVGYASHCPLHFTHIKYQDTIENLYISWKSWADKSHKAMSFSRRCRFHSLSFCGSYCPFQPRLKLHHLQKQQSRALATLPAFSRFLSYKWVGQTPSTFSSKWNTWCTINTRDCPGRAIFQMVKALESLDSFNPEICWQRNFCCQGTPRKRRAGRLGAARAWDFVTVCWPSLPARLYSRN